MFRRTCATALVATLSLAFIAPAWADTTVGSGRRATESRPVTDFESIALSGSMKLVVRQAAALALQVQADDNVLPLVETVVEPREGTPTLLVRLRKGTELRRGGDIVITVDVVRLTGLSTSGAGSIEVGPLKTPSLKLAIAGAGDAKLRGLATDRLEAAIAGSGDIRADGQARELRLSIAGSGDADLRALEADEVKVGIAGSGDAEVTAHKSLSVSIAGSGDVRYTGQVEGVKTSVVGSGQVRRR